ncbi:hypothetical protein D3C87_1905980 [compost metagenome]
MTIAKHTIESFVVEIARAAIDMSFEAVRVRLKGAQLFTHQNFFLIDHVAIFNTNDRVGSDRGGNIHLAIDRFGFIGRRRTGCEKAQKQK